MLLNQPKDSMQSSGQSKRQSRLVFCSELFPMLCNLEKITPVREWWDLIFQRVLSTCSSSWLHWELKMLNTPEKSEIRCPRLDSTIWKYWVYLHLDIIPLCKNRDSNILVPQYCLSSLRSSDERYYTSIAIIPSNKPKLGIKPVFCTVLQSTNHNKAIQVTQN